ncbi:hypothetical protein MTP99_005742 [Tenebrio molitor]|nr:hypothetical protein MTP99_005742 [Tenebrio molitor]
MTCQIDILIALKKRPIYKKKFVTHHLHINWPKIKIITIINTTNELPYLDSNVNGYQKRWMMRILRDKTLLTPGHTTM